MNFHLKIWRQRDRALLPANWKTTRRRTSLPARRFWRCSTSSTKASSRSDVEPIAHDSDCREGICGTCSLTINGVPHGNFKAGIATCQLHMRTFRTARRSTSSRSARRRSHRARPDRGPFRVGPHHPGGRLRERAHGQRARRQRAPVPKQNADLAMDAAACIGCGACAAACPNASAMLFASRKRCRSFHCCRRARPNAANAPSPWSSRWTTKASATAPTSTIARPCARRKSARRSSRG